MKLTHKQETFAQAVANGMTQSDAYRHAYDSENMTDKQIHEEACVLAKNPKVSQMIQASKDELSQVARYDREAHYKELEELRVLALTPNENGKIDLANGIKATELKGKMTGQYTNDTGVEVIGDGISVRIVTRGNNG
jgi:phage terminase small subunit